MAALSFSEEQHSPLEAARKAAGLTLRQLGELAGVSHVSAARWCNGEDRPPAKVFHAVALVMAATGPGRLREEHDAWLKERRRKAKASRLYLEVALPPGVDVETAREKCIEVLGALMAGERGAA